MSTYEPFPSGSDPRKVLGRKHRERGPKKHFYTFTDIATIIGASEASVRQSAKRGRFDVDDLRSVIEFVIKRRGLVEPKDPGP